MLKYYYVFRIHIRNFLVYFSDFISSSALIAIIMFVLISMWRVLYADRSVVAGLSIAQMVWYIAVTEALVFIPLRNVAYETEVEVRSGSIAYQLTKPINYVISKLASLAGYSAIKFLMAFASSVIMALVFVGPIDTGFYNLLFGAISFMFSFIIGFLIIVIIGLASFWLEESSALYSIYDKMRFILGGFLFPLEILPYWLEIPARYLPFSAILYYPARIFVDFSWQLAVRGFVTQIVWILILSLIVAFIYRKGIRKVNIHGG